MGNFGLMVIMSGPWVREGIAGSRTICAKARGAARRPTTVNSLLIPRGLATGIFIRDNGILSMCLSVRPVGGIRPASASVPAGRKRLFR